MRVIFVPGFGCLLLSVDQPPPAGPPNNSLSSPILAAEWAALWFFLSPGARERDLELPLSLQKDTGEAPQPLPRAPCSPRSSQGLQRPSQLPAQGPGPLK